MQIKELFVLLEDIVIMVPFLMAIVQVIKSAFSINSDLVPALSVILGILIYLPFGGLNFLSVFVGAALGLMGSGVYDNVKSVKTLLVK